MCVCGIEKESYSRNKCEQNIMCEIKKEMIASFLMQFNFIYLCRNKKQREACVNENIKLLLV
jgi:hypothetical protein